MKEEHDDKNFESFFRDRFENYSGKPASDAWKNIQAHIGKKPAKPPLYKAWWLGIACLVLLLGVGGMLWWLPSTPEMSQSPTTQKQQTPRPLANDPSDTLESEQVNQMMAQPDASVPIPSPKASLAQGQKDILLRSETERTSQYLNQKPKPANKAWNKGQPKEVPNIREPALRAETLETETYVPSYKPPKLSRTNSERPEDAIKTKKDPGNASTNSFEPLPGISNQDTEPVSNQLTKSSSSPDLNQKRRPKARTTAYSLALLAKKGTVFNRTNSQRIQDNILLGQKKYLLGTHSLAERPQTRRHPPKPSYLSFQIEPSFAFYRVLPNRKDDIQLLDLPENQYKVDQNLGIGASIHWEQRIFKSWSISIGARYSTHRGQLDYTFQQFAEDSSEVIVLSPNRFVYNPVYQAGDQRLNFSYDIWGVQVGARFHPGKWRKDNGIGLSLALEHVSRRVPQSVEEETQKQNSINPALTLDYRLALPIGARWQLRATPNIRFNLSSFYQDHAVRKIRPYHWGLHFGVAYRLR